RAPQGQGISPSGRVAGGGSRVGQAGVRGRAIFPLRPFCLFRPWREAKPLNDSTLKKIDWLLLPLLGVGFVLAALAISSSTWAKELPSPLKTWQASKPYVLEPFAKRGEMDQGILRFTWYSLLLVAKGYALALLIGTPIGFFLGLSKPFAKTFDPIIQVLRP